MIFFDKKSTHLCQRVDLWKKSVTQATIDNNIAISSKNISSSKTALLPASFRGRATCRKPVFLTVTFLASYSRPPCLSRVYVTRLEKACGRMPSFNVPSLPCHAMSLPVSLFPACFLSLPSCTCDLTVGHATTLKPYRSSCAIVCDLACSVTGD